MTQSKYSLFGLYVWNFGFTTQSLLTFSQQSIEIHGSTVKSAPCTISQKWNYCQTGQGMTFMQDFRIAFEATPIF